MSDRTVSLTFDDGPDPLWTPRVLDELRACGARATFFVGAPLVRLYPALVGRMVGEGHGVQLHCARHVRHSELRAGEVFEDAKEGLFALEELGVRPSLWRPPWGIVTPETKRAAEVLGLGICLWTADTHDWRGDASEEMLRRVEENLRGGCVILMHDGLGPGAGRKDCRQTEALIRPLVERVRALNLTPAPVARSLTHGPEKVLA